MGLLYFWVLGRSNQSRITNTKENRQGELIEAVIQLDNSSVCHQLDGDEDGKSPVRHHNQY